jgi:hypothetical protein
MCHKIQYKSGANTVKGLAKSEVEILGDIGMGWQDTKLIAIVKVVF